MTVNRRADFDASADDYTDFVPAVFAREPEQAEAYRQLLNDHDIPAIVGADDELEDPPKARPRGGITRGVPILVPEILLDEASEVIADRHDTDDFEVGGEEEDEDDDDDELGLTEQDVDFDADLAKTFDDEEDDRDAFGDADDPEGFGEEGDEDDQGR